MSETAVLPRASSIVQTSRRVLIAGVGLASFASLLLELALTRLFSVVLFYHFAFLAISVALLGLGAGGVFAYLRRAWLARWPVRHLGAVLCGINAAVFLLALEVMLHVPVQLDLAWANFGRLSLMYVAAALSFFLTGVLFSSVFARETRIVTQLYAADLVGGALACLAVVPLLNWLGGPNTVVFAALAMAGAAVVWAEPRALRLPAGVLSLALIALLAANHSGRLIDIVYAKGRRRDLPWMLFARWNALSRVEVDQVGTGKYIVIDADAATAIMNVDPQKWGETQSPADGADHVGGGGSGYNWKEDLMSAAPAIANVLRPHGAYAVIGPGGGVDVLRAVANGSPSVTAIEINPLIANTIMRGLYADYSYHLYELPQVHMHVGDGRSWIRGSREKFDVVQMTLVDTWASTAAGAFALSENNLYTVEAFREYFDHLQPEGFIAITRWEFRRPREALRVVSQAIAALQAMGVADVSRHFIVIADGPLDEDGRPVTVLAKKTPFTSTEERQVLRHIRENVHLYPLYTPELFASLIRGERPDVFWVNDLPRQRHASAEAVAPFQRLILLHDRAALGDLRFSPRREFIRNYPFNIAPVSDDAPFFFFTFKAGDALRNVLGNTGRGMDWKNNLGVVVLGMVLVISLAAVLGFLVGPLVFHGEARERSALPLLYFVALGLGYILVEIALIQRFVLFLGHPTYALTVVVFLMLLASGAGSAFSVRILSKPVQVRPILALIAAGVGIYVLVLPRVLGLLVGLPFAAKVLISGLLLAPIAFAMGMPFPAGLRQIERETLQATTLQRPHSHAIEWAWAMNAASSVLGSVLAMVVAIQFGLSTALACGAVAYVAAILLTLNWGPPAADLAAHV
ncbi:MAG TPA: hypothetical protein VEC95_03895 [Terriglobales bacterium]|nr:hypothetical protein [Terriglobales bacterium]